MTDKKRICIYHFFDSEGVVDDYVIYNLKKLKDICSSLIFSVNGTILDKYREVIENNDITITARDNIGFDFGSWKDVITSYKNEIRNNYDELIITNDSYYGPIYPWIDVFNEMDTKECDFWGLTVNEKYSGMEGSTPRHIQSYFLVIRKKMLNSEHFYDYWIKQPYASTFKDCVINNESKFTKYFENKGFKWCSFCNTDYENTKLNGGSFQNNEDELIINYRLPIVKRKSLIKNDNSWRMESAIKILDYLKETDYDVDIIRKHIIRTYPLSKIFESLPSTIVLSETSGGQNNSAAIVIIDDNCNYLLMKKIDQIPDDVPVYVLTDNQKMSVEPTNRKVVIKTGKEKMNCLKEIICNELCDYDYICLIHEINVDGHDQKKLLRNNTWDNLIPDDICSISTLFKDDDMLGVLYPPLPAFDCMNNINDEWSKKSNIDVIKKIADSNETVESSIGYETESFWCRRNVIVDLLKEISDNQSSRSLGFFIPYIAKRNGCFTKVVIRNNYAIAHLQNYRNLKKIKDAMATDITVHFLIKHPFIYKMLKKVFR